MPGPRPAPRRERNRQRTLHPGQPPCLPQQQPTSRRHQRLTRRIKNDAGVTSTQGIDCSANNGPVEFVFNDRNGDHEATIKVCIEGHCPAVDWFLLRGY